MKLILSKLVFFVVAVICTVLAQASALDQFKTFISNTHSAKGEFIQRQMKVIKGQEQLSEQSSGTFMFARPGKFIWLYQKPYEQLLQADGQKLYIYDKDLNQVTIKTLGSALSSSPAAILFGSNDFEKNFILKEVGKKDGIDFFQAIPKDKDSTFSLISIGMQNGVPREMNLRDNFNKTTLILFRNLEKNPDSLQKGQSDLFKFTIPAGTDVFQS